MDARSLGKFGEERCARYLRLRGYRIREMNFSCRHGEIDIIAQRGAYIVFVEVKLRKSAAFAEAREFVTRRKQQRVILAAQQWLQLNPTKKQPRFDVIEVYAPDGAAGPVTIRHLENAFDAG